jgi:hypothetical protein
MPFHQAEHSQCWCQPHGKRGWENHYLVSTGKKMKEFVEHSIISGKSSSFMIIIL